MDIFRQFGQILQLGLLFLGIYLLGACDPGSSGRNFEEDTGQSRPHQDGGGAKLKCADRTSLCAGPAVYASGEDRYCVLDGTTCVEATRCDEIEKAMCGFRSYIPGKSCGNRSSGCIELFDCTTFKSPTDCQGKPSSQAGIGYYNCFWSYKRNQCESISAGSEPLNWVSTLASGGGTVCADMIDDHHVCWGDDTGNKYSHGSFGTVKTKRIELATNFACAEIETKAPTSIMANDGEYAAKCWGGNPSVVNNTPNGQIERYSLVVNDNVACALVKAGANKNIKCWGDFAATMVTTTLAHQGDALKPDVNGVLQINRPIIGVKAIEAKDLALGSDFICASTANIMVPNVKDLFCSGKTKFSERKQSPIYEFTGLTAASDFGCLIAKTAPNTDKAYCFRQPGATATYDDTFMFGGGAKYSPDQFEWISAHNNYLCGMTKAPNKKLTCYNAPAALAVPAGIDFYNYSSHFAFGDDFICGITKAHKVQCWGSNAAITGGVPDWFKHK